MLTIRSKVTLFSIALLLIMNCFISSANCDDFNLSASSAILVDSKSGRILYSKNPYVKLPMASTTKIMTALIAMEYGNLDEIVIVKRNSVGIEGSSIYLHENEEISLRDLVYGLMLRSGNDAAMAIANHIGGSSEEFIEIMNKKANEIGASNTNFTNPHGLHDNNHYTSAYDLALITREAMKYPEFREISKTKSWKAERENNNYFYNKNKTLWQYDGGDGVKIGYTKAAGRCLVSSATRNGIQLISVVLNDGNWFNDCYALLDYGFTNFNPTIIYDKGQFIRNVSVINGSKDSIEAMTDNDFIFPLSEYEKEKVKVFINLPDKIIAPVIKGQILGSIKVFFDGHMVSNNKLIAKGEIEEKSMLGKINSFILNWLNKE